MRAVDTNVIVRYLLNDEPTQAAKARRILGHEPIFVPTTVLLEVEWVLRIVYDMKRPDIFGAIRALAGLPDLAIENPPLLAKALDWAEAGMDFADALHLAAASDCEAFLTFDKKFARSATRFSNIPVTTP